MGTETLPRPDWGYWVNLANVSIRDAVALSCDLEPRALTGHSKPLDAMTQQERSQVTALRRRETWATSAAKAGDLGYYSLGYSRGGPLDGHITLAEFRAWGESLPQPLTFPPDFPESDPSASVSHRWPWGDHETELLRVLALAGEKFWARYVPGERDTAPNSDDVAAWIMQQSTSKGPVAKRVAEVMAQILRADGLPTGPR